MEIQVSQGTVVADGGEEFVVEVQTPAITQERAEALFDEGVQVGDWHWKYQTWLVPESEVEEYLAAICFYYGLWLEGERQNVKFSKFDTMPGLVFIEAWYGCN